MSWATAQLGSTASEGYCERFAENAFGTQYFYGSAIEDPHAMLARGQVSAGDREFSAGALAFFGPTTANGDAGHVMISIGAGRFISSSVAPDSSPTSPQALVTSGEIG